MNYLKENPKGVDVSVNRVQKILYEGITCKWGSDGIDGYGRIYANRRKDNIVPEYYTKDKEYREVLLDDTKTAIFFFNIGDADVNGRFAEADCEILFSVNLYSIGGNETRDDEEVRNDVVLVLDRYAHGFSKDFEIIKGLDNVYSGFRGCADYFKDMQEFHHFKLKGKIRYNINC